MSKPINKNTMEICKDIDLPKLKEFLEKLGWSIRDYGYGHFRIFNEYGKPTQWVFYRGILELDDIGEFQPFGKTPEDYIHNGHFHLDLKLLEVVIVQVLHQDLYCLH